MKKRRAQILALDTGGTMTDAILIDTEGNFVVGKSQTTPDFIASGIMASLKDAADQWGLTFEEVMGDLESVVYTGTLMLNRIVSRNGVEPLGMLTTAGFEDTLRMGRGMQSWKHLSLPERMHATSHFHPEPIIPRRNIRGVRERVLATGYTMVPLYEDDVRRETEFLIRRGVKAIIIGFLNSFVNAAHEARTAEIVKDVLKEHGMDIPVFLSHKLQPLMGELGRLNTVVIQVYATEPSRTHFKEMEKEFRKFGNQGAVRLLTNYGTTVSSQFESLIHTVNSGPTGGIIATKFLGDIYGEKYLVGTDVGGTSFDVGVVMNGKVMLKDGGFLERFWVNIPMAAVESIGAGTGSYVSVDTVTKRIKIGPESAGYRVGTCWAESGVETVTVNDANLLLGFLNPDNFLGGQVKLDKERAYKAFKEQVADKLGIPVLEAAWGVHKLINLQLKMYLQQVMLGKGFGPENFIAVGYGGGGPLHTIGYTEGLDFAGVMIPTWAPGFSAFGGSAGENGIRQEMSMEVYVPPREGIEAKGLAVEISKGEYAALQPEVRQEVDRQLAEGVPFQSAMRKVLIQSSVQKLADCWNVLKKQMLSEADREGLSMDKLRVLPGIRMRFAGMVDDIEVQLVDEPVRIDQFASNEHVLETLIERFEENFERIFARASRSSEFGYQMTRGVMTAYYDSIRPHIKEAAELASQAPEADVVKETRGMYWEGEMYEAKVYDLDTFHPGNVAAGPCLIEGSATTIVVPPEYKLYLDRRRVFWAVRPNEDVNNYYGR